MKLDARDTDLIIERKGNVNYRFLGREDGIVRILIYNQSKNERLGEKTNEPTHNSE